MNMHIETRMDPSSITSTYWRYAIPTLFAMLVSGLYNVVDGIFIGNVVGREGLAAINMAWPINGLMLGVGLMIGTGTGALCGLAQGAGDQGKAASIVWQGLWLLAVLGALVGIAVVTGSDHFLAMLNVDDAVRAHCAAYIDILGWAAPLVMTSIALPVLVRNLGAPRLATGMMVAGAVTNIALDYLFIAQWGWGLRGAAIATVAGESLSVAVGLMFLFSRHSSVPLRRFNRAIPGWQRRLAGPILGNGASSLLMYLYASFSVLIHNAAFMQYGSAVNVAAYAITGYVMMVYYLLAEGLAGGMQPIASYFHGAGQSAPVRQAFRLALNGIVGGGMVMVAAMLIWPTPITRIFVDTGDAVLQAAAMEAIRLHLFALFLDGFLVLVASYFQAVGQGRKAIAITFANMAIQLPFLLLLPPWLGATGVLLAMPISTAVLFIAVLYLCRRDLLAHWFTAASAQNVRPKAE